MREFRKLNEKNLYLYVTDLIVYVTDLIVYSTVLHNGLPYKLTIFVVVSPNLKM